jgi:Anti-sigma-K factor rskA
MVLAVVPGSDHDPRPAGAIGVNEDDFAEFLDSGRRPPGPGAGEASPSDTSVRFRDLLADDAVWAEPSPRGADDLLAAIQAESRDTAVTAARPSPPRAGVSAHRRLILSAAAGLVILAGALGVLLRAGGDGDGRSVEVAGTELAPEASAVARVEETGSGVAIELDVSGLPPAERGTYYQAWMKGPDGLVTVGTFHLRGGDDSVELWSGVPPDRYPTLTVTLQQEGVGQESSGRVVLSGDIGG